MRYVFPISNNNTIFFTGLYQHWKHWLTAHPGRAQTVDCHTLNQDQPFFNFLFALVPSWRTDRAGQCIRVLGWPVLPKQKGHTYKINKQITLQNSWVHGISLNWIIESGKLGLALDSFHYFDKALWLQDNENEAFFLDCSLVAVHLRATLSQELTSFPSDLGLWVARNANQWKWSELRRIGHNLLD